jgi:pimeloyl-ACP methyl ester carboxylesterase
MFYFHLSSFKFLIILFLTFILTMASFLMWSHFTNRGNSIFTKSNNSNILVVLLHGYTHTPRDLNSLDKEVQKSLPNADIFRPYYSSWLLSNTDPIEEAFTLVDEIATYFNSKQYDKVILIGHSTGAVIIRKAYLYALGIQDDVPVPSLNKPKVWATKVDRIITLAGMNRGFNYSKKPNRMNWLKYWSYRIGIFLGEKTGSGKFIRSFMRGSPFIANLRVQWIRLAVDERFSLPPTIQLIGMRDDVVEIKDNYDLASDRNFRNILVQNTGHASIIKLDDPQNGSFRRSKFRDALQTPVEDLETQNPPRKKPSDVVVIVQHGIRETTTIWRRALANEITRRARDLRIDAKVITPGYGYFPMGRFLIYRERQNNVRMFMDDYTEALAENPRADIHFVGHSNGTYILANALKNYATFKVNRVVFAGSVVRRDFPWDEYSQQGRVNEIRNDVATGDWVVGIFPRFLEIFGDDVGSAGHNGFIDSSAQKNSYTGFFPGDHGAAIQQEYHPSIAEFILTGQNISLTLAGRQNDCVILLSKLSILVWIIIIGIILGIGWFILTSLGLIWLILYIFFLIILLGFI